MTEQATENYLIRDVAPDRERVEIQNIPQIIQWPNGATPEPIIHHVSLPSTNGNQPDQNEDRFTDICYEDLITEDDEPVDNIPSEKQQRLLAQTMYASRYLPEPFLVTANVGLFDEPSVPPIVPDVMVSLGVQTGEDPVKKENRSYFVWKEGKPPEVVVEIVSNKEGNETGGKFERYAAIGVKYYVIIDEAHYVQEETLVVHELEVSGYAARDDYRLPDLNLALTFWDGIYEQSAWTWVRWCSEEGDLLLMGEEQAELERQRAELAEEHFEQEKQRAELAEEHFEQEKQRAEQEKQRAEQEEQRAEQEKQRAEQEKQRAFEQSELAALYLTKLREAGIEIED